MPARRYPRLAVLLILTALLTPLLGAARAASAQPPFPPVITKSFATATIPLNGTTTLTFSLANPNPTTLTGVSFVDTFPPGLVVAAINNLGGSCVSLGGVNLQISPDGSRFSYSTSNFPGNASCSLHLEMTGTTGGVKVNTVTVQDTNAGTGNTATATLTVLPLPTSTPTSTATGTPLRDHHEHGHEHRVPDRDGDAHC